MRLEGSIAQFLLDPVIREKVKPVLEKWMFETDVYRALALTLCDDQFNGDEIDKNVLELSIRSNYPSLKDGDFNEINRLVSDFSEINQKDVKYILNIITDFVKKKVYTKGIQYLAEDNIAEAEVYLSRATNLVLTEREYTKLSEEDKLFELLEHKFPKDGKYIKSSFGVINTKTTYKGYCRGDLVQIVAPTGRGKTSMMCQEAGTLAHQGFKVGYAIIGDNTEDDIAIKVCSYYSRTPITDVIENFRSYLADYKDHLDNITTISYSIGSVTAGQLLADFKNIKQKEGLDVLFVDYDANLAMEHVGMYESGGLIYAKLKAFAQDEDCVVIVASQPKLAAWTMEIIGVEHANESSKKQHNVDLMITFNWREDCNKIGTMHLAKVRRGETGATSKVKFNHHISELKEISKEEYDLTLAKYTNSGSLEMTEKELRFED